MFFSSIQKSALPGALVYFTSAADSVVVPAVPRGPGLVSLRNAYGSSAFSTSFSQAYIFLIPARHLLFSFQTLSPGLLFSQMLRSVPGPACLRGSQTHTVLKRPAGCYIRSDILMHKLRSAPLKCDQKIVRVKTGPGYKNGKLVFYFSCFPAYMPLLQAGTPAG